MNSIISLFFAKKDKGKDNDGSDAPSPPPPSSHQQVKIPIQPVPVLLGPTHPFNLFPSQRHPNDFVFIPPVQLNTSVSVDAEPVDQNGENMGTVRSASAPTIRVLPSKFDLTKTPSFPAVLNQGSLGSCASNAASNVLRYNLVKEKQPVFQPSRLYIYYNTRVLVENQPANKDTGVSIKDVCKSLSKFYACDETYCPYNITAFNLKPTDDAYNNAKTHSRIKYSYVIQDMAHVKAALWMHNTIIVGVLVYQSFQSANTMKTGIVVMPDVSKEKLLGGHALHLVGWDDDKKMFKVQNSWGTGVGDKGFFYIPYEYLMSPRYAFDFWTIESFY